MVNSSGGGNAGKSVSRQLRDIVMRGQYRTEMEDGTEIAVDGHNLVGLIRAVRTDATVPFGVAGMEVRVSTLVATSPATRALYQPVLDAVTGFSRLDRLQRRMEEIEEQILELEQELSSLPPPSKPSEVKSAKCKRSKT